MSIIIGLVELKSRTVDVSDVVDKLKNCSVKVLNILNGYSEIPRNIYHIVLAKGYSYSEIKLLKQKTIRIGRITVNIITKRCGTSFADIIREYQ